MKYEFDYGEETWPYEIKKGGFLEWHWSLSQYENDPSEWSGMAATRGGALRAIKRIKKKELNKPNAERGNL